MFHNCVSKFSRAACSPCCSIVNGQPHPHIVCEEGSIAVYDTEYISLSFLCTAYFLFFTYYIKKYTKKMAAWRMVNIKIAPHKASTPVFSREEAPSLHLPDTPIG